MGTQKHLARRSLIGMVIVGAGVLAGCGGGGEPKAEPTTSALVTSTSSAPSTTVLGSSTSSTRRGSAPTGAAVSTPAPPPTPLSKGCAAPTTDLALTSGVATADVTSGPGTGRMDLAVQPSSRSGWKVSGRDLRGEWKDAAGKLLYITISSGDPCKVPPDAFVRIEPEGKGGKAFVDAAHTKCKVELAAFSSLGVDGSFTCTQLGGGGEGVFIDAKGTFSLRP